MSQSFSIPAGKLRVGMWILAPHTGLWALIDKVEKSKESIRVSVSGGGVGMVGFSVMPDRQMTVRKKA